MKGIKSKEEMERKQRRNKFFIGGFMILILVISTLGFIFSFAMESGQVNQNVDGEFYDGNYWVITRAGQTYYFLYKYEEVKDIPVESNKNFFSYSSGVLNIATESDEALSLIATNVGRYARKIQRACYGPCEKDFPEKDCSENIIVFVVSENKRVYEQDKCVFIEGDLSSIDAFNYKFLGLA